MLATNDNGYTHTHTDHRNQTQKQSYSKCCVVSTLSPFIPVIFFLLYFPSPFSPFCLTRRAIVLPAVTDVLYCCFSAWKEGKKRKPRLVLHMSALFSVRLRSWPHYTDLHTCSPFPSLSACLFTLIAECRWALFSQGAGKLRGDVCVCVCTHTHGSFWPSGWEGSDRGLDMLKRQSKWVFLKQWRKYRRFMPGQFMSPYLFLKHVTLATAEW